MTTMFSNQSLSQSFSTMTWSLFIQRSTMHLASSPTTEMSAVCDISNERHSIFFIYVFYYVVSVYLCVCFRTKIKILKIYRTAKLPHKNCLHKMTNWNFFSVKLENRISMLFWLLYWNKKKVPFDFTKINF